jgi:F-type H+-transporting ATPase subunit epsilon
MQLEVVTPTGNALTTETDEVIVPGAEGEFGVLAGHTPFMSALKPGTLRYRTGGTTQALSIGAGLVEVTGQNRVVVLTDRASTSDAPEPARK